MRNWKNWLFPILTCLTVAALALLPLRLSTLQDGELTGTVHAEPLSADSNFPFKPPELPGRIWLLVQWQEMPDNLTIMAQELTGGERDRETQRLRKALAALEEVLPSALNDLNGYLDGGSWEWEWERYYLRDQTNLSSASFSRAAAYSKVLGAAFSATLDGESGELVTLQFYGGFDFRSETSPQETGMKLLDRLGLAYQTTEDPLPGEIYGQAVFHLTDCMSWFLLEQSRPGFTFHFNLDWDAVEASVAASYGYPVSTDAGPMQK